jgi:hypothetical protein
MSRWGNMPSYGACPAARSTGKIFNAKVGSAEFRFLKLCSFCSSSPFPLRQKRFADTSEKSAATHGRKPWPKRIIWAEISQEKGYPILEVMGIHGLHERQEVP